MSAHASALHFGCEYMSALIRRKQGTHVLASEGEASQLGTYVLASEGEAPNRALMYSHGHRGRNQALLGTGPMPRFHIAHGPPPPTLGI